MCLMGEPSHNLPGKIITYAVSTVLRSFQRSSNLPDHDLQCDPATPQPCFFQTLLYLHRQVGQETLGLVHLLAEGRAGQVREGHLQAGGA